METKWKGRNVPVALRVPLQLMASAINWVARNETWQEEAIATVYRGTNGNPFNCTTATIDTSYNHSRPILETSTYWSPQSTSNSARFAISWDSASVQVMRPLYPTMIGPLGLRQQEQVVRPASIWRGLACEALAMPVEDFNFPFKRVINSTALAYMYEIDVTQPPLSPAAEQQVLAEMRADFFRNLDTCFPSLCTRGKCSGAGANNGVAPIANSRCEK